jgi:hypothetical protein
MRKPVPKQGWKRARRNPLSPDVMGDQEVSAWTTLHRAYDPALHDAEPQPALKKLVAAAQSKLSEAGFCPYDFRACGARSPDREAGLSFCSSR